MRAANDLHFQLNKLVSELVVNIKREFKDSRALTSAEVERLSQQLVGGDVFFTGKEDIFGRSPQLKLFYDFFSRAKSNDPTIHDFCFLDYWLPEDQFYAMYLVKSTNHNPFKTYAQRLGTLYLPNGIRNIIFDTNKVMAVGGIYTPFVISRSGTSGIDHYPNEYFVNLNEFDQVLKSVSGKSSALHLIRKKMETRDYIRLLRKYYEKFCQNNPSALVQKISSRPVQKALSNSAQREVSQIRYDNIHAAFLTYLVFVLTITPEDWVEYVYYPCQAFRPPNDDFGWIGGMLMPYKRDTSRETRLAYQAAVNVVVSYFYLSYTHALLREEERKRGAGGIAGAVAHNMRNILEGFDGAVESHADHDIRLYVQARYVTERINWLKILSKGLDTKDSTNVTINLISDIIAESFVSAWEVFLIRAFADRVDRYIQDDHVVTPLLEIKMRDSMWYIYHRRFAKRRDVGDTLAKAYVDWIPLNWSKTGKVKLAGLDNDVYSPYRANILEIGTRASRRFYFYNGVTPETTPPEEWLPFSISVKGENVVAGVRGAFEESFFNALRHSKPAEPMIISVELTDNDGNLRVTIKNQIEEGLQKEKKDGGDLGNRYFFIELGWGYIAEPVNSEFHVEVTIPNHKRRGHSQ